MILTPLEIEELTSKKNRDAQVRALNHLGIEHKVRADGSVVVLRSHAEIVLGGNAGKKIKNFEPNWGNV